MSASKSPFTNSSQRKIPTFHGSNKKINYAGDGEDGLKSKTHADILRD